MKHVRKNVEISDFVSQSYVVSLDKSVHYGYVYRTVVKSLMRMRKHKWAAQSVQSTQYHEFYGDC